MTNQQKEQLKKIAIGGLIALAGALATYLQDAIPTIDFGTWQPIVFALNSMLVNALRKLPSFIS